MKKLFIVILLAILSFILYIYAIAPQLKKNKPNPKAIEKTKLTFGVHPYLEKQHIQEKFHPFVTYLAKRLNKDIELKISPSYNEHLKLVGTDAYDISYIGPYTYINMVEEYGEKDILASMTTYNVPYFNGIIFVPINSSIYRLKDLLNKNFAFGKASSTMSHHVPSMMLKEAGIMKEQLAKYEHLNHHEEVVYKVLSGEFDAGSVKEAVYDKYKDKGLKEIARSRHVAEHVFVASNNLYPPCKKKIADLLLTLNENKEGQKILFNIKAKSKSLKPAIDENFNSLREYLEMKTRFKFDF